MRVHASRFYLILFLGIAFLTSCTIQKRSYQKGYYISFKKQSGTYKPKEGSTDIAKKTGTPDNFDPVLAITANSNPELTFNEKTSEKIIELPHQKIAVTPPDSCGDLIIFKNGANLSARIIEVSETEIKFNICGNDPKKIYINDIKIISEIRYVNGSKNVFEKIEKEVRTKDSNRDFSQVNKIGILVSIAALCLMYLVILNVLAPLALLVLVLLISAFALGFIALIHAIINRFKFRGIGLAILTILLSAVGIVIMLLANFG